MSLAVLEGINTSTSLIQTPFSFLSSCNQQACIYSTCIYYFMINLAWIIPVYIIDIWTDIFSWILIQSWKFCLNLDNLPLLKSGYLCLLTALMHACSSGKIEVDETFEYCNLNYDKRPKLIRSNFQTWILQDCSEIWWRRQSKFQAEPNLYHRLTVWKWGIMHLNCFEP